MAKKREERETGGNGKFLDGIIEAMPVFAKELVAGGVAGGVAKSAVAPLERVKILFQTRRGEFQSMGLLGSIKKIAKTEGVLGFYRGNGASVARIVPYAALHYMAYEQYRRWIILSYPDVGRGPFGRNWLIRLLIHQNEPSRTSLYRGVAPSLYGIFPYAGLKFYFYEEMKLHVPEEDKKNIMVKLVCGSVAGLMGQTFTYPLDVVRRQMQVERLATSNSAELKGTMESLVMIVQKQGWKQLFSGLSINYLKVVPSVAIGFTIYDVMKLFLRVPSRDAAVIEVVTNKRNSQPSLHSS
ncbi:hypothetical protein LWI29_006486 [Acer saccharum]|uniref:Mitochondrial carrier protein n=1 Tax=Acer saccharum TaxID=4024 RepID=A0AA39RCR8_ACESA|nr:hypothetical protein LWI29_006486 [Acer saccharum]